MTLKRNLLTIIFFSASFALSPCKAYPERNFSPMCEQIETMEVFPSNALGLAERYHGELESAVNRTDLSTLSKAVECRDLAESLADLIDMTPDQAEKRIIEEYVLKANNLALVFYLSVDAGAVDYPGTYYEEVADFLENQWGNQGLADYFKALQQDYERE